MGNAHPSKRDDKEKHRLITKKRSSESQLYTSKRKKKKKKMNLQIAVPHHDKQHPHNEIEKKYSLGEPLGQGHYGIVRRAIHRETGDVYAVKIIPKWKVENPELVMTEIEILQKLDHPNVVKYYETIEDYDTYYIVMELCSGGELFDRIIDTDHKLSLVRIARITTQILRAVEHCHDRGIVNRDIKSENVLFKTNDPDSQIKVIDFGLSAIYSDRDNLHARVGTVFYMSPEVLAKNYTTKCDIWSVGILLYVMLSGCLPFYGATDRDTAKLISKGLFAMPDKTWKHVPSTARDLVRQLLRYDPNKRPTANQALKHPWLHQEECPVPLPPSIFSSMRDFVAMDRFRQLARFVIAEHVPETEIVRLRDAFKKIDVDNSGMFLKLFFLLL